MRILEDSMQLERIVDVHLSAFPGFFLSSMGRPFLRLLYRSFMEEKKGICLAVEVDGRIQGFAAGTTDPQIFFRTLLRKKWYGFIAAAIPGVLRNPMFVTRKCIGALCYRGETPESLSGAALLSSLAVSPEASGKGIGQQLVRSFCDKAVHEGCHAVYLTTDNADNEAVNRFYSRCGFELSDTFIRPGRRVMNRWVMRLK